MILRQSGNNLPTVINRQLLQTSFNNNDIKKSLSASIVIYLEFHLLNVVTHFHCVSSFAEVLET